MTIQELFENYREKKEGGADGWPFSPEEAKLFRDFFFAGAAVGIGIVNKHAFVMQNSDEDSVAFDAFMKEIDEFCGTDL